MEKKVKHTTTINTAPKVKQRPRMTRRGRVFTPKETLEFENTIKEAWDGPTFESPVSVDIILYKDKIKITVTEQEPKKKSPLRGDIDNYVKAILDGLNGSAFVDDRQVVSIKARKA
jgi:crossover junction endodeoxyribonuclease RusA